MNQQLQLLSSSPAVLPLLGGGLYGGLNDPLASYYGIEPYDPYDIDPYILACYCQAGMIDVLRDDIYLSGGRSGGRRGRHRNNMPLLSPVNIFGGGYGGLGGLAGYGGLGGFGGYGGYSSRRIRNRFWPLELGYF